MKRVGSLRRLNIQGQPENVCSLTPEAHHCVCVCVFLLHCEDQSTHFTHKMRTILRRKDILAGAQCLNIRLRLKLGVKG